VLGSVERTSLHFVASTIQVLLLVCMPARARSRERCPVRAFRLEAAASSRKKKNGIFANPVRGGCDHYVVQPHLQFCHAIELNLSQGP
jgi:hypothetical protein